MKKTIEIKPVCPFLGGKECITDGMTREVLWNCGTAHPCMFWDAENVYNGDNPSEPCRVKRAINRILADEVSDQIDSTVLVPWNTEERNDSNGKKAKEHPHDTKRND